MSIDIHGSQYVTVAERVKLFREQYPNYSLISELVKFTDDCCIVKASVIDESGRLLATGYAKEYKDATKINATSFLEVCETSAWGRALGNFLGKDLNIASAEETVNAIIQQNAEAFSDKASDKQINYLRTLLRKYESTEEDYLASYGVKSFDELDKKTISEDISKLKRVTS